MSTAPLNKYKRCICIFLMITNIINGKIPKLKQIKLFLIKTIKHMPIFPVR